MTIALPSARAFLVLIVAAAALGACLGAVDRARGVPSASAAIFSRPPAPPCMPGQPAAAPATVHAVGGGLSGE
ncbi:MAG: hypothetical protein J0H81_14440 [Sphingopyxis terrae]|nr:hypothetical protein [Sphingopyxis terrae]